jgi:hypothetical protein
MSRGLEGVERKYIECCIAVPELPRGLTDVQIGLPSGVQCRCGNRDFAKRAHEKLLSLNGS